jgi:dimethylglycine dehydrogenase
LVGDEAVGYVSSGGFAHHLGLSMAFAYVPVALAVAGTKVDVEINGVRVAAEVQDGALYDPKGLRMRS